MSQIKYGYAKNLPPKGYVNALKCDGKFYVITKKDFERVQQKLKVKKPVFFTDLPVYIDGVNI